MFIELAEFLRCPEEHEEATCVVVPREVVGRNVLRGTIGCAECRREYPIENGIARFGAVGGVGSAADVACDSQTIFALMGLSSDGGYAVLLGSVTGLAPELTKLLPGVHFIGINAQGSVPGAPGFSLLEANRVIPLRNSMARAVVIGSEFANAPWLAEGVRVLLRGLRLVVCGEQESVDGTAPLAVGAGLWVAEKR